MKPKPLFQNKTTPCFVFSRSWVVVSTTNTHNIERSRNKKEEETETKKMNEQTQTPYKSLLRNLFRSS